MARPSGRDYPSKKDAQGRWLCRNCKQPVPKGRRSYCGEECRQALLGILFPGEWRRKIFKRDRGICAHCKADTVMIQRVYEHAKTAYQTISANDYKFGWRLDRDAEHLVYFVWDIQIARDNWEADHIIEVCRGGSYDLENIQTLCVPCHKAKTKRMHGERAAERKAAKRGTGLFQESAA